jgi:hypothetical protein
MSDPISSNFNNSSSSPNSSPNQPKSTGDALIDSSKDLSVVDGSPSAKGLDSLSDRTLASRLATEREASRYPQHLDDIKSVSKEIPREAVGLSFPSLAPDQISSFANAVQIPQAWTEINQEISPLYKKYLAERNSLADSVMGNKLSTLAALLITPPLGLAALVKHKTSQEALQQISEKQVNFLVKTINGDESNPLGNLKQVLINTAQALDVLNGLSLDNAMKVAESGSLAAPALKLVIGLFRAVDKSDPTVTSSDRTITGTDIVAMKEFLQDSIATLNRPVEEIKSKINSDSGLTALKVFVGAMSDTPAYIEEKYNKLRDPLAELGVSQQQSDQVTGFLKNIADRVSKMFTNGADQAAEIVNKNASDAQAKTTAGLLALANKISTSSEAQQVVNDAGNGLQQVAPLVSQITQNAAATLQEQLKSIGIAAEQMSRASKADSN